MQCILNKIHQIWEHNQHLLKASPDQCTQTFERVPEAEHSFIDQRSLYLLNNHHFSESWTDICCWFLSHRAEDDTNTPSSFSHAVSPSHLHWLWKLFLTLRSEPPHSLSSHKILSNLNPIEDGRLQRQQSRPNYTMLTRRLSDTRIAWCGYTRLP